jgi:hypothetical protein
MSASYKHIFSNTHSRKQWRENSSKLNYLILPPFLDIRCIVYGTEIKKRTWRDNYTRFWRDWSWTIDMIKYRSFQKTRKHKQIPKKCPHRLFTAIYVIFWRFLSKNYTPYIWNGGSSIFLYFYKKWQCNFSTIEYSGYFVVTNGGTGDSTFQKQNNSSSMVCIVHYYSLQSAAWKDLSGSGWEMTDDEGVSTMLHKYNIREMVKDRG